MFFFAVFQHRTESFQFGPRMLLHVRTTRVAEALTNATQNVSEHGVEHMVEHKEHIHSYMVLLFLFFALLLGLGSRHLLSNLPIPYTGLLLLWGLAFGYIDKKAGPYSAQRSTSLHLSAAT